MSLGTTDAGNCMLFKTTLKVTSGNLCCSTIDAGNQSNLVTVWRLRPLSR